MFLHRPGGQTQFATPVWARRADRSPCGPCSPWSRPPPAATTGWRPWPRRQPCRTPLHPGVHRRGGGDPEPLRRTGAHRGRPPRARDHRRHARGDRHPLRLRHRRDPAPDLPAPATSPPTPTGDGSRRRHRKDTHDRATRRSPSRSSTGSPPSTPSAPTRCSSASPRSTWSSSATDGARCAVTTGCSASPSTPPSTRWPDPDVLVFPGGFGTRALEHDEPVLDWVRRAHATTLYTTSVCTGSLVLAAAGLLDGLTATTHWASYAELEALRRDAGGGTGGRAPRPPHHYRGGRVERDRHGPATGRAPGRPDGGRSGPADDRVRPEPPFDVGLGGQGVRAIWPGWSSTPRPVNRVRRIPRSLTAG